MKSAHYFCSNPAHRHYCPSLCMPLYSPAKNGGVHVPRVLCGCDAQTHSDSERCDTALTMRYCSVSMITSTSSRSAYLWNSDLSRRAFLAAVHLMIGCSCMWSPIRMIRETFGENPTSGISVSGSVHMALSSTIIYTQIQGGPKNSDHFVRLLNRRSRQRERLSASMLSICSSVCLLVC